MLPLNILFGSRLLPCCDASLIALAGVVLGSVVNRDWKDEMRILLAAVCQCGMLSVTCLEIPSSGCFARGVSSLATQQIPDDRPYLLSSDNVSPVDTCYRWRPSRVVLK